jgi:Ca-activated chloride channel family protein
MVNRRPRPNAGLIVVALACAALAVLLVWPSTARSAGPGDPVADRATDGSAGTSDAELQRLRELHYQESEQVRLVLLPAVVTTRRGRPVTGLEADDFRLFEDYVPQEIRYFGTELNQPVSIAFLLDISGSMRQVGKLDEAKQAIRVFVDALAKTDRFGLVCFADDQVAWITEFTTERERFLRRLEVQHAYGQTALFDALAAAPRLVDEQVKGRKAIVLITDGIDNASQLSVFDAVQLARSVNVPIYTIGFTSFAAKLLPKGSRNDSHRVLQRFSEETGGLLFTVNDPDDLKEAVLEIQNELRFQYLIGYRPTRELWDGTFRRVRLEAVRGGLVVRTRTGYYANP